MSAEKTHYTLDWSIKHLTITKQGEKNEKWRRQTQQMSLQIKKINKENIPFYAAGKPID